MLQFLLCDDNVSVLTKLTKMFDSLFIQHGFDAQVVLSTPSATEALEYVMHHDVHVIVLDIDLKSDLSGLDLAEHIRKFNKDMYLIFTTGHLEYTLLAYKYKTFDFLPKPITKERLEETVLRLFEDVQNKNQKFITLDKKNRMVREQSIEYIKKEGMKLIIHADNMDYEMYGSFQKLEPQLSDNFVRCHKSFIVNLDKITNIQVQTNQIQLFSGSSCLIGPKYKNNIMEVFFTNGNFSNDCNCINH